MAQRRVVGRPVYTPSTVTDWFEIPRSTLFRWESTGDIAKAERGPRGERVYRWPHIRQIAERIRRQIARELELALGQDPDAAYPTADTLERLYRAEFFGSDNPQHGLAQLKGLAGGAGLSPEICDVLLRDAQVRPRGDAIRTAILELLLLDATRE